MSDAAGSKEPDGLGDEDGGFDCCAGFFGWGCVLVCLFSRVFEIYIVFFWFFWSLMMARGEGRGGKGRREKGALPSRIHRPTEYIKRHLRRWNPTNYPSQPPFPPPKSQNERTKKEENKINGTKLTNRQQRKKRPEPINRQKPKIDPHDPAPSLHQFKRYRHVPGQEQRRRNDADEGGGPGEAVGVGGAEEVGEEVFEAGEEEGESEGEEGGGIDAPFSFGFGRGGGG